MTEDYDYYLNQITQHCRAKDIEALQRTLVEIDRKWGDSDRISYVNLLRAACDEIRSRQFEDKSRAQSIQVERATLAVEKADDSQMDLQLHLLTTCLRLHDRLTMLKPSEWPAKRKASAALWLGVWSKLERLTDPQWDLKDPRNEVAPYSPPPGVAFPPGGAPPEAVEDPAIRADYEAHLEKMEQIASRNKQQLMLRNVRAEYTGQVEAYIVALYTIPPFDLQELRELLDIEDEDMKSRILDSVSEKERGGDKEL